MATLARGLSAGFRRGPLLARPLSTTLKPMWLPTAESARSMPSHMSEASNDMIFVLAEQGNRSALRERVRREIMVVDDIDYAATTARVIEMSSLVRSSHSVYTAPYQLGIASAMIGGYVSLPLVFEFTTASKFNDLCVTADPPEVRLRARAIPSRRRPWQQAQ